MHWLCRLIGHRFSIHWRYCDEDGKWQTYDMQCSRCGVMASKEGGMD